MNSGGVRRLGFLMGEMGEGVGELAGGIDESGFYGILGDVVAML